MVPAAQGGIVVKLLDGLTRGYRRTAFTTLAADMFSAAAVGLIGLVIADWLLVLGDQVRVTLDVLYVLVLAGLAVNIFVTRVAVPVDKVAAIVDKVANSQARIVLSAVEISRRPTETEEEEALKDAAVERAENVLSRVDSVQVNRSLSVSKHVVIAAGTVLLAFVLVFTPAFLAIVPRYADPFGDHPPYSPFEFEVTAPERVKYGDRAEVSVKIAGPQPDRVVLAVRSGAETAESICFRGEGNVYRQTISNVLAPIEFWFGVDYTRTKRHRMAIVNIPEVTGAAMRVMPPFYMGEAIKEIVPGTEPVKVPKGADVRLSVISNRPLTSGTATLTAQGGKTDSLKAQGNGSNTLTFAWQVEDSSAVSVSITDIDGLPSESSYRLAVEAVPDLPPQVNIESPPEYSLATPDAVIPVKGTVSDDYGIRSVSVVKALAGWGGHTEALNLPAKSPRNANLAFDLKLSSLGVVPGEEIDIYAEASDYCPYALNIGMSRTHRLVIVSVEEYVELLRKRVRIEELANRYAAYAEQLGNLRQTLSESGDMSAERKEELAKAAEKLADKLEREAQATPLYDFEQESRPMLADRADRLRKAAEALRKGNVADAKKALGGDEEQQSERDMAEAARRMEKAARLLALENEFVSLVNDLKEIERKMAAVNENELTESEKERLKLLSVQLEEIKGRLEKLEQDIIREADALPPELGKLAASARAFVKKLDELDAGTDLKAAADASASAVVPQARKSTTAAREKLEKLISKEEGMSGAAGECMCFKPSMITTIRQLSLGNMGKGGAAGYGNAGGASALSMPAYGPATTASFGDEGGGKAQNIVSGNAPPAPVATTESRPVVRSADGHYRFNPAEGFPEAYRDALIRYFKQLSGEE